MSEKVVLYSYWRSSASWRVRAALLYKGIEHEIVPVNLVKGEQADPENLARNPSGFVPTLDHKGDLLVQSPAILEFLEDVYPVSPLLPADPVPRARVRALAAIIACDTHPIQNLGVIKKVASLRGKEGVDTEFAKWVIEKGFTAYERAVAKTMGKYSVGDSLSIADLCLIAQHYNAVRFNVDLTPFPNIVKLVAVLSEEECIQKSHPSTQPDAV
ncbi:maleylacetoacetate isomerase [Chytriomyces sp. MP71]|nr:maleylacetoacetate isomerase [Chytriomyces sp. MP71]